MRPSSAETGVGARMYPTPPQVRFDEIWLVS